MTFVRIRRAPFVVVVAALGTDAVVACSSSSDRPPAGGISSSRSSSGSSNSSSGGTSGTTLADGGTDADSVFDASLDGPMLTDDGSCLDDRPSPKMDAGDAAPTCPSGSCTTHCTNIVSNYNLGVAQTAVACLLGLPDCSDLVRVNTCVDTAVGQSCKDTTSRGYCMPLVTTCDPNAGKMGSLIDEPGCESIANALSGSGRSTFADCIQSKIEMGTCPTDIRFCTDELRQ